MIVKTTSWHYRFNVSRKSRYLTEQKKTLCQYFWFTVANILKALAYPLIGLTVLTVLGRCIMEDVKAPLLHWWTANPDGFLQWISYPFVATVFLASVVALALLIFGVLKLLVIGVSFCHKKLKAWKKEKVEPVKREPGLLGSYLKARKEKLCPIIKFEDDQNV